MSRGLRAQLLRHLALRYQAGATLDELAPLFGCSARTLPLSNADVGLAGYNPPSHAPEMFVVSEAEAAAIRDIFHERGELAAAAELRRLFPGITDDEQARESARIIAGWRP
jgi:hypothetical protein